MKHAYRGSQPVVDVPSLGLFGVRRGEPVDIEASRSLLRQLRRQGWEKVSENSDDNKETEGDGE